MVFRGRGAGLLYAGRICHGGVRFYKGKNAGNIIMKNLMDFCIVTVVFCLPRILWWL